MTVLECVQENKSRFSFTKVLVYKPGSGQNEYAEEWHGGMNVAAYEVLKCERDLRDSYCYLGCYTGIPAGELQRSEFLNLEPSTLETEPVLYIVAKGEEKEEVQEFPVELNSLISLWEALVCAENAFSSKLVSAITFNKLNERFNAEHQILVCSIENLIFEHPAMQVLAKAIGRTCFDGVSREFVRELLSLGKWYSPEEAERVCEATFIISVDPGNKNPLAADLEIKYISGNWYLTKITPTVSLGYDYKVDSNCQNVKTR